MFACRFIAASAARSAAVKAPGRDGLRRRGGGAGQWLATLAATAVSTYALDLMATTAGVALAASQILGGADHGLLLAFLVGTYVTWAAGLRLNLAANWTLLEETGTSTNAFSKAAYELLRRGSRRARRIASALGYVATEVVKEVPYYAGASGAVLLTDSVSSADALVFLGGANLGAAGYEYGLARMTHAFVRSRRGYASFEFEWIPREYLADYYSEVERDERETIAYFVDAMREVPPGEPVLFFGVGPTLHHVFLAAGKASEIHLADYLPENLAEIQRWLDRGPGAHDWSPFVRYTLECEGLAAPTDREMREREEITRRKIARLLEVDARHSPPLPERYATVVSAYCADSATSDRATWEAYTRNIAGLVGPAGTYITAALRRADHYLVGGKSFPSANVDEHDVADVLAGDFEATVEVRELAEQEPHGYAGVVLARARRKASGH